MVGLSIVLEKNTSTTGNKNKNNPQIISKVNMNKPVAAPKRRSLPAAEGFLDRCFLCRRKLLAGKDIYMYKGDSAFCSEECRCKQILMDEEEINTNSCYFKRENCSTSSSWRNHKGISTRNGTNGFVF